MARRLKDSRPDGRQLTTIGYLAVSPFQVVAAFVIYVNGPSGNSAVIKSLPVGLGLGALMLALFHLAWFFDWGGTATGSSTAGLAFIFVPFVATLFTGVIGFLTSCVIDLRSSKS